MNRRGFLKSWKWLIGVLVFAGLLFLLDSCMQFRMSKTEIEAYFAKKEKKGSLHSYPVGKNRIINYLKAGDETLPLVVFVHGSPGSLDAFIDFMADTALLKRAQLITVDRPGFGASNFGYAEPSLEKQATYLRPILEGNKKHRPIILVGHSLGGPVIARMAMEYGELIDGLVIVAVPLTLNWSPTKPGFGHR